MDAGAFISIDLSRPSRLNISTHSDAAPFQGNDSDAEQMKEQTRVATMRSFATDRQIN
jgi:hypothetical protein